MEEDFYASIKLKTGEEIFSKVSPSDEGDKIFLILDSPVMIKEIGIKNSTSGYKVEPWIKTSTQDIFLISMEDVLTIAESNENDYFVEIYLEFLKKYRSQNNKISNSSSFKSRRMGYISSVTEAKKVLEKIFKDL